MLLLNKTLDVVSYQCCTPLFIYFKNWEVCQLLLDDYAFYQVEQLKTNKANDPILLRQLSATASKKTSELCNWHILNFTA